LPATLSRVALVTQQFRWNLQFDATVAGKRLRARVVEEQSYCSTEAGAIAVNTAVLTLLKGDSTLIEVGIDPLPPGLSFDRLAPTVTLVYIPLGLNKQMVVVGKNSEVKPDGMEKGILLLW
jgi:hypothetical protein